MAADVSTAESEAKVDDLFQLNQNTFYEYLAAAGDDLVVVDFYTTW